MWVRQFVAGDGACSYLLACPERRRGVLLQPDPTLTGAYERALDHLDVTLDYVLEVEQVDIAEASRADRFESLVCDLGLCAEDPADPVRQAPSAVDLQRVPRVRPVRAWQHSDPFAEAAAEQLTGVMVLQVGERLIEVASPPRPDLDWFTAGEEDGNAFAFTFGRARVQVGSLFVEILPVPERADRIAYRVHDRVFTGAAVSAGTGIGREEGTPPSLLSLPPDTLVYPSRVVGGVRVSTIGAERARLDGLAGGPRKAAVVREREPAPEPSLPRGAPSPAGYIDVSPAEAWRALDAVRVVDIRNPREAVDRIPGARVVAMMELQRTLMSWDRQRPLLVVSESGMRSDKAASMAVRMGFSTVYHLVGGMELWRDAGLPLRADASSLHELC